MHLIEQPSAGWLINRDIVDHHNPNIGSLQESACFVGLRTWVNPPLVGETRPYQSDD
jgi:hypothetical protein